jgi:hypothetical protein
MVYFPTASELAPILSTTVTIRIRKIGAKSVWNPEALPLPLLL